MSLRLLVYSIQQNSSLHHKTLMNKIPQICFQCCRTFHIKSNIFAYNSKEKGNGEAQKCHFGPKQPFFVTNSRTFSISSNYNSSEKRLGAEYEDGTLLYLGGNVGRSMKRAQAFLYSLGALSLAVTPVIISHVESEFMKYVIVTWAFFFGVMNPAGFYKFSQRYVLELYYNKEEDKYTAYVPSPFVKGHSKIVYTPQDCRMPTKMTPFTSFLVKDQPMFVNSDAMNYSAYMKMLRCASEFDYENPERQQQYKDAVQASIERISETDGSSKDKKS